MIRSYLFSEYQQEGEIMAEEKKDDIVIRPRRIEGILDDVYKDFFGGGQRPADYDWLGGGVPGIDLPAADSKKKTAAAPKAPDLSELDEIFKRSSMQNILAGTELAEKAAKTANTDILGNPYPDFSASSSANASPRAADAGISGAASANASSAAGVGALAPDSISNAADVSEETDAPKTATTPAGGDQEKPKEPEKTGTEELYELIGLSAVKKDVRELVNLVKTQKLRKEKGLRTVPVSLHLVFSGNPGTGKTTVARILAKLYKEIGVLSKGQLVEVDRSGLVAGYVGQTAIKTQKKIEEAKGGILFIDEAYTLAKDGGNDFGQEAIDTVLKAMEDNREDLVVIVAGYTELMEKFINSNPGLKSRFNKYINFDDYTAEELMAIFEMNCKKYSYEMTPEAREAIEAEIRGREAAKGENFANARDVRNLFEAIITNQASRIAAMEDPTDQDLMTILPEDLQDFEELEEEKKKNEEAESEEVRSEEAKNEEADSEEGKNEEANGEEGKNEEANGEEANS